MAVDVDHVNDSLGSSKTVHTATLDDSNLELSITVLSRAVSMSSTPLYHDGDTIIGTVHINSSKNSGIQDISISLRGQHSCYGKDTTFLRLSHSVWSPERRTSHEGVYERNLRGTNIWNFSIPLPACCNALDTGTSDTPLPPSFGGSGSVLPETINYEISCTVRRRFFSGPDEQLSVPIQYRPQTVAGSAPLSRSHAYNNGTPIPGPEVDAEGWSSFRSSCSGDFFSRREVNIDCEFSLAAPLEYARGGLIPFAVRVSTTDQQLLDLLAVTPDFLSIHLQRQVLCNTTLSATFEKTVSSGRYWVTAKIQGALLIAGEINASAILQPSFQYGALEVAYLVQFFIGAPGLHLKTASPIGAIPVQICARRAPGPRPISYAPTVSSEWDTTAALYSLPTIMGAALFHKGADGEIVLG
ncbi:hypothetical protein EXIGLDRAFT_771815 [Exidia glandulosa HHB12029]|uniref:Arrestin-like N-terminal domain-containing protein n=1 Tax=Exidia glandulosa HHB12029 TaxID=1314781 RepID=A0A165FQM8_EXIGL|nr:hypothetical protein EXIGLDRAFT_771815 [Exidia glandulosa HHB12029]